jgi:hypothetical protein
MPLPQPRRYNLRIATDDLAQAIAKTGSTLYDLLDEALMSHEPHDAEEDCEFEEFTREMLRVLGSYPDQLAGSEEDAE